MASKTIVVVLQEDANTPDSVKEFENVHHAARFIEGLLAAGFDRRRIRALAAQPVTLVVTRRPVVSLVRRVSPAGSDSESMRVTADNKPRSRIPGDEPRWAPLGDGAVVSIGDCALATISLN